MDRWVYPDNPPHQGDLVGTAAGPATHTACHTPKKNYGSTRVCVIYEEQGTRQRTATWAFPFFLGLTGNCIKIKICSGSLSSWIRIWGIYAERLSKILLILAKNEGAGCLQCLTRCPRWTYQSLHMHLPSAQPWKHKPENSPALEYIWVNQKVARRWQGSSGFCGNT